MLRVYLGACKIDIPVKYQRGYWMGTLIYKSRVQWEFQAVDINVINIR